MADSWKTLLQMTSWLPDRWEAPDREFFGHRDISTQSFSRYHFVAPHVHGVLLDVGCGRGYGFEAFAHRSTVRVGIDISMQFLVKARDQFPGVFFSCANGSALPLADNSFDSVIAFEVIEHIRDDLFFLRELKRVVRPEAFIALSTPNKLISSGHSAKPLDRFHVREYKASEFRQLLKSVFSSVELFGQYERLNNENLRDNLIDRIPIRWKYFLPHYMQAFLSVAFRPPLRLEDCRFESTDLQLAHTFVALCRP